MLASQGQLTWACWLVFAGALFDVFDGLAARALGGGTPLGAQLDSLADMVTFGVAPAFLLFKVCYWDLLQNASEPVFHYLLNGSCILLAIASGWRLAKFNIDTRQTSGFLGLPTPANGLFWASIVLSKMDIAVNHGPKFHILKAITLNWFPLTTVVPAVLLSALMLSELPLPSLKFKHFQWKGNEVMFLLLGIGLVLVVLYGMLAVPMILLLYLLSPLWGKLFPKQPA